MPACLDSGAMGFAEADSVGPGDGDANEDAKDAARHLAEDKEGDVRRQKRHALWTRACRKQLGRQQKLYGKGTRLAASAGKPKKIIKSDIVNFFVA